MISITAIVVKAAASHHNLFLLFSLLLLCLRLRFTISFVTFFYDASLDSQGKDGQTEAVYTILHSPWV